MDDGQGTSKNAPTIRQIVAGAIYDFAAGLTCRKDPITLGSSHEAGPAAVACQEFLKLRGCDDGEPEVRHWTQHLDPSAARGLAAIKAAMREDYGYAWGWHCVVACSAMDEGLGHASANAAAARFMKMAFDIDTSVGPPTAGQQETSHG